MQHPGPVVEAQPELQINRNVTVPSMANHPPTHSVTSQSPGHNLTVWYSDISPHLLMYRVEIKQLPAFLSWPTDCLPKCLPMYGQSTTSTTPCMFSYAWHIIGYDWLSRFKKKKIINIRVLINQWLQAWGREGGGQEGPLSLCLDEVKVRRGEGHTHTSGG